MDDVQIAWIMRIGIKQLFIFKQSFFDTYKGVLRIALQYPGKREIDTAIVAIISYEGEYFHRLVDHRFHYVKCPHDLCWLLERYQMVDIDADELERAYARKEQQRIEV